MAKQWTAAQSAAMNLTDKTLLISAAAGSGKTATLTQRIIKRLTDVENPGDLSKMLIVTFTRSAADELKARIFSALSAELAKNPSDKHLTSQLIQLGSAKICTIDAFYLELIRSNFSQLGLSPSFRIADPTEMEVLSGHLMEETIDFFYETDENFPALSECLTGTRNSHQLSETLLRLSEKAASFPEGIEFLHLCSEQMHRQAQQELDFFSTEFGKVLRNETVDAVRHFQTVFSQACQTFAEGDLVVLLPSYSYDYEFCSLLLQALSHPTEGYRLTQETLASFSPIRLKPLRDNATEESNQFKELRTAIHGKIRDMLKKSFSKPQKTISRAMEDTARHTDTVYRLLKEYENRMDEEKKRRNMLDFNDIRRQTLRLLVDSDGSPTSIAQQYAEEFQAIYIDEYQDVDRVQDLIFRSISKSNNRFMVGDIKQSIYGFRGAEPSLFAKYRTAFPAYTDQEAEAADGVSVFMSENFRCDSSIIDFTNLICSKIFSACSESIGYRPEDDLRFAKPLPDESYQSPRVEVTVLSAPPKESLTDTEPKEEETPEKKAVEAEYIASEIERLIHSETKADSSPIYPGDIAVLFRSRSMSPYLNQALNRRGILTSESDGEHYFENPDVLMVLCLLNAVDNPHRDIFLSGTLRSPLFEFTMDDLIAIRRCADSTYSLYDALLAYKEKDDELAERCRTFDETLNEYRRVSSALPVDRFLRYLFESEKFVLSGFLTEQTESGEGGNLLRLYEYARTFEAGSFKGLYNFIEFINTVIEEGKKIKTPPKGISKERVNLMTIHQSKGLEFPVCFVCNVGARFNLSDQQSSMLFEYPIGLAMKIADSTGFARINTPMREALCLNSSIHQREEEMRVLYVALTRARERLYVTAYTSVGEEKLMAEAQKKAMFCTRYALMSCKSYLEWILIPFAEATPACANLSFRSVSAESAEPVSSDVEALPGETAAPLDEELYERLKEKYAFRYPYAALRRIPAKLSISRLSPDILDEEDTSLSLFEEETKAEIPDFFLGQPSSKQSPAERGTATHLFLQFCDFQRAVRLGAKEELARLVEQHFIPENLGKLVYLDELESFLHSPLIRDIQQAKKIIREQRFNLLIRPENFTQNPELKAELSCEQMAIQGVIDLIVVDAQNRICLFDYKTDRLTEKELADTHLAEQTLNRRHGLQLSYYAYAAEQLFGRPCHQVCIYSTHAAKLYPVRLLPPVLPTEIVDTL